MNGSQNRSLQALCPPTSSRHRRDAPQTLPIRIPYHGRSASHEGKRRATTHLESSFQGMSHWKEKVLDKSCSCSMGNPCTCFTVSWKSTRRTIAAVPGPSRGPRRRAAH